MKRVFSSNNVGDVGLLRNGLDEAGIAYELRSQTPPYPLYGLGQEIWVVNGDDFLRACEVRDNLAKPPAASLLPSWTCPACGERLEGQFTSCWKCGAVRGEPA